MWGAQHGPRRSDHYYALTALLSARGVRVTTSRVIALAIFGLALTPLGLVEGSAAPPWGGARVLAVVIAGCAFVLGLRWLRHRWPSRTESAVCASIGTILVAIACLLPSEPVYGLLGATAFALIVGYTALFHTARLLGFTLTVAAATTLYLAVRLAADDIAMALASAILVGLLNVFVAFTCRMVVWLTGSAEAPGEVEPLTGLLNRASFYELTATLLGSRSRDDDRYLVVAVVDIDSFAAMVSIVGSRSGARAREGVGHTLRETVRRDAIVGHVGEAEFLIADTFTAPDPSPLVERVRGAIAANPSGTTASIGVVSTPLRPLADRPPHEVLDEIVAIATTAMSEARRAGGNQACYVVGPSLGSIGDEPDDSPLA